VSVPFDQNIKKLAKVIRRLDGPDMTVDWQIKELTVRPDAPAPRSPPHRGRRHDRGDLKASGHGCQPPPSARYTCTSASSSLSSASVTPSSEENIRVSLSSTSR
jgi:hypothetical protein